jgi:lysophospholipase L1-like esterase
MLTWSTLRWTMPSLVILTITGTTLSAQTPSHPITSPRPALPIIVFTGDSITWGAGATNHETASRPSLLATQFATKADVLNLGINGYRLRDVTARISEIRTKYRPGTANVVIIDAGSNDFPQGAKAIGLFAQLQTYVDTLVRDGWYVGIGTILKRDLSPASEQERQSFNMMIRKSYAVPKGNVSVLDYARAQAQGLVPLADGVHPNDAGYRSMNNLERPFVIRRLAQSAARTG